MELNQVVSILLDLKDLNPHAKLVVNMSGTDLGTVTNIASDTDAKGETVVTLHVTKAARQVQR